MGFVFFFVPRRIHICDSFYVLTDVLHVSSILCTLAPCVACRDACVSVCGNVSTMKRKLLIAAI